MKAVLVSVAVFFMMLCSACMNDWISLGEAPAVSSPGSLASSSSSDSSSSAASVSSAASSVSAAPALSWTAGGTLPSGTWNWTDISFGNSVFVALASGERMATSPDGAAWAEVSIPWALWNSLTFVNGQFIALADNTNIALTSTDGTNWTTRSLPEKAGWMSVAWGNDILVAVSTTGAAATSGAGAVWSTLSLTASSYWKAIAFGNNLFVAISGGGTVAATSPDGTTWTTRTLPSVRDSWTTLVFNGTLFLATSDKGEGAVSTDGIDWTKITGVYYGVRDVAYGNGLFVGVEENSGATCATSLAGNAWTTQTLPDFGTWKAVAYGKNRFVAISSDCKTVIGQ